MKTIKELAEYLGVSKTAIRKKAEALGILKDFIKEGNKRLINEEQEEIIIKSFSDDIEAPAKTETKKQKPETENQTETAELLPDNTLFLISQITTKDKQIEELNKRIKELNIINAGLLQSLQNEQERIKQLTAPAEEEAEQKNEKKRGFFARLFNFD